MLSISCGALETRGLGGKSASAAESGGSNQGWRAERESAATVAMSAPAMIETRPAPRRLVRGLRIDIILSLKLLRRAIAVVAMKRKLLCRLEAAISSS